MPPKKPNALPRGIARLACGCLRTNSVLPRGQKSSQVPGPFWRPQLPQRLSFDLADAFARDVKLLPNLLKRVLTLAANAEAQPNDLLFFRREGLQNVCGFVADVRIDHRINR